MSESKQKVMELQTPLERETSAAAPVASFSGDLAKGRRILILAPTRNDARLTADFLGRSGMITGICNGMESLCHEILNGCGAILIAEEAMGNGSIEHLAETLSKQPSWSDIPLTVITSTTTSETRFTKLKTLDPACNVTILERPFRPETLIRNVEVALRARRRQYQIRDLLEESRRRQETLRVSEKRFRKMSDSAPMMIWIAGLDRRCIWLNRAWLDFTGRSMNEETGDGWRKNVHPDDAERCARIFAECLARRSEFQMEYRLRRHDGVWRWLLDHGVPLYEGDHQLTGYIGSCVDITERKETMAELERIVTERTATLRETIGDLEAFSYTVSHDLRAPLRAVQSYAQVLKDDYQGRVLDDTGTIYLDRIASAGRRLDGLIQDVLAYSRVARQDYPMRVVELGPLIKDILRQYPQFRLPAVEVTVREPLCAVRGSEALLTQCLSNLLGNATKFVPPDRKPEITVYCEERSGGKVRVWVKDNGIGIAPDHQARIFGMFERLDQKGYEGTGVGLAIVRKAVERMDGEVGVISRLNEGSSFWLELHRG